MKQDKVGWEMKRPTLGLIVIAVVMFFVALATDAFWIGRLAGKFPSTMPVNDQLYRAFAAPDIILSVFLYVGALGLLRLKKFGLAAAAVALGMWLFDSTLVLGITGLSRIGVVGPSLGFDIFALAYIWAKRDLFE
jgi:hypothetical protein